MKISTRVQKSTLFIVCAILLGLFCVVCHPLEPHYQWKSLSAWTHDFCDQPWQAETEQIQERQVECAREAIQHIGARALPYALKLCRTKDTPLTRRLLKWANSDEKLLGVQIISAAEAHSRSWQIFSILEAKGKPAIPALIKLFENKDPDVAITAFSGLCYVGPDAIRPLIEALTNRNDQVREYAALSLGNLGYDYTNMPTNDVSGAQFAASRSDWNLQARPAAPRLLQCLKDKNDRVRAAAAFALGNIRYDAPTVVPALMAALEQETNDEPMGVCLNSLRALSLFRTNALPAVPLLIKILQSDRSEQVHQVALRSLHGIAPETAQPFLEEWQAKRNAAMSNPRPYRRGLPTNRPAPAKRNAGMSKPPPATPPH